MQRQESTFPLGRAVEVRIVTENDTDTIALTTTLQWRTILLDALQEREDFKMLLDQTEAQVVIGLDTQAYRMNSTQTEEFLQAVRKLINKHFP